jgi:hypothetical protein
VTFLPCPFWNARDTIYNAKATLDQMESGLLRHVPVSAHDWSHVLTFEGKSCSVFGAFTTSIIIPPS